MSKKNRNRSRKQRKQANHRKKSLEGAQSSHQLDQTEIIQITNANKKIKICTTIVENFSLEPVGQTNSKKSHLDENTHLFIKIKVNLFDLMCRFGPPNSDLCMSKIYYRFDLIIDLLFLIPLLATNRAMCAPKKNEKKRRPGYIIERDCHIFGGCVEEEAQDEFFISSGAVYQSWPYVYEPGFKMTPLVDQVSWPLSKSANSVFLSDCNGACEDEDSLVEHDMLPSYSIENFGINLINCQKRKKRKNWNSNGSEDSCGSSTDECFYEDSDSDDSESIIAYKQRHAVGLNCFDLELRNFSCDLAKCCSASRSKSPRNKRVMFFSQKRCDSNGDNFCLTCSNHEFFSFKKDRLTHKYSFSSDNLVF
ncbi:hypothetical protein BpHYR1_037446 [Brachionus plicatilis]|uniref:Uncharacterized protein n=1 Tax=Brachionus plicatilis TaxID=10195 RepID=A0A3M7SFB9_BRAPC|nr:hypothetical protein BpHYR1_037446 [Brachionus plicatilis]